MCRLFEEKGKAVVDERADKSWWGKIGRGKGKMVEVKGEKKKKKKKKRIHA